MEQVIYAFLAWLIYWLAGMLNAVAKGEAFSGKKTVYSLLVTLVVILISLMTGLSPEVVWQAHGDIISSTIAKILETGAFLPLIYIFEKFFGLLKAIWNRAWKQLFT